MRRPILLGIVVLAVSMLTAAATFEFTARSRNTERLFAFAHMAADLVARQTNLTSKDLDSVQSWAPTIFANSGAGDRFDMAAASIGDACKGSGEVGSEVLWLWPAASSMKPDLDYAKGMAGKCEAVVWVKIRYRYPSLLSALGLSMSDDKQAFTRPRMEPYLELNGARISE